MDLFLRRAMPFVAMAAWGIILFGCAGSGSMTARRPGDAPASGSLQDYPGGTVVEPDNPNIRYIGHWDETRLAQSATTANSGSRIVASFTGHHLYGLFDTQGITNPAQIYMSIDGGKPVLFKLNARIESFTPAKLKGDRHNVEIAVKDVDERANRWVPSLASAVVFKGFILDSGAKMLPLPPPGSIRMEFYGDSITQGVRALSMALGPDGSDATKDFAFLAAMAFGAISNQIGFGRQGIIRPGNGRVPPAPQSFGWNFQGSRADPSFIPQVVVVNQGTNDQMYPSAQFRPAYRNYIAAIRKAYPDATILCMRPFGGFHEKDTRAAVQALADRKIVYVDTTGWLSNSDYTDGIHPNAEGHLKAAEKLVAFIEAHAKLKAVRNVHRPWWE